MSMTKLNQNTTDLQALAASTGYQEVLDLVNALPDAGGSGGASVEYEIITIPAGATSATYTLPRVTAAFGSLTSIFSYSPESSFWN